MSSVPSISQSIQTLPPRPELTHVAIGVFDGFHRGHQQVVARLLQNAPRRDNTAIITFEPHPLQIIAPERAPKRLSTPHQKRELLLHAGVAEVITLTFDPATRDLTAYQFVDELLRVFPNLATISMGPNWSFGKDRQGNAALLLKIGRDKGFAVHEIEPFCIEGEIASSTRIRETIEQRDFTLAATLLGRSYAVEGKVVHGDGRGRSLGFPTANLSDVFQILPPPGVYACFTRFDQDGKLIAAQSVLNIGNRPTFGADAGFSIEAHLLDFSGDLYNRTVELSDFVFLRGEQKFPGVDALKNQIAQDIVTARGLLRV